MPIKINTEGMEKSKTLFELILTLSSCIKKGENSLSFRAYIPPPAPVILSALGEFDLAYFDSYLFY